MRKPQTDTDPEWAIGQDSFPKRRFGRTRWICKVRPEKLLSARKGKEWPSLRQRQAAHGKGTLNCLSVPKGRLPSTILSGSRLAANWLRCVSLAPTSPHFD